MANLSLILILVTFFLTPSSSFAEQKGYSAGGNYKDEPAPNPCGCPSCMKNNAEYARNCHASEAAQKKFDTRTVTPGGKANTLRATSDSE